MSCTRAIAGLLLVAAVRCCAEEEADFIGAESCRPCHQERFAEQRRSAHAGALHRAEQHPLLSSILEARSGSRQDTYRFEFTRDNSGIWVTVTGGNQRRRLKLDWAFGSGSQGITFVSRVSPQAYLEHAMTYYPRKRSFGLTPGHERFDPDGLEAALGIAFQTYGPGGEIVQCFQCHSTGPVSITPDDAIEPGEPGIGCEACHGAGSLHRRHAQAGALEPARGAIVGRRRMDGAQVNRFCGACHRSQIQGQASVDPDYAWNVRHQPPYLERSSCFQSSAGRLSCITCHDPHKPLPQSAPAFYAARCTSCHGQSAKAAARNCGTDCVSCHMPVVDAGFGMQFHNHWIGIFRQGPLRPGAKALLRSRPAGK